MWLAGRPERAACAGYLVTRWRSTASTSTSMLAPLQRDLATMTGNVAQVFLTDDAWAATLRGIRATLRPGGLLVLETRDPAAHAWLEWDRHQTYAQTAIRDVGLVTSSRRSTAPRGAPRRRRHRACEICALSDRQRRGSRACIAGPHRRGGSMTDDDGVTVALVFVDEAGRPLPGHRGHASPAVTMSVYAHALNARKSLPPTPSQTPSGTGEKPQRRCSGGPWRRTLLGR